MLLGVYHGEISCGEFVIGIGVEGSPVFSLGIAGFSIHLIEKTELRVEFMVIGRTGSFSFRIQQQCQRFGSGCRVATSRHLCIRKSKVSVRCFEAAYCD